MAYPSDSVDGNILQGMDKLFAGTIAQFQQVQNLANKSAAQLSNLTDNIFLQMTQLYQAAAAQNLETNKLARDILAQRSAMNQPQQAPSVIVPEVANK